MAGVAPSRAYVEAKRDVLRPLLFAGVADGLSDSAVCDAYDGLRRDLQSATTLDTMRKARELEEGSADAV